MSSLSVSLLFALLNFASLTFCCLGLEVELRNFGLDLGLGLELDLKLDINLELELMGLDLRPGLDELELDLKFGLGSDLRGGIYQLWF